MPENNRIKHPFDTPLSAGLRFGTELIAWIAGPWAAGAYSAWLIVPALAVLVGLPSVFSTPGDKNVVVVPTPGPLRVLIELFIYSVALLAPWMVWPQPVVVATSLVVVASVATGIPRIAWLFKGAPDEWD